MKELGSGVYNMSNYDIPYRDRFRSYLKERFGLEVEIDGKDRKGVVYMDEKVFAWFSLKWS